MAARAEAPPLYREDWRRGRVASWVTTVDHKRIGILYMVTSLVFFGAGGLLALLIRAQLATPDEHFVTRNAYNELFTIHGTTMIFLFIVPFWAGLANFLAPLMIGARDMAFPRLNAASYWFFLFGGAGMFLSFLASGGAAKAGWYSYPPLSEKFYSPGTGQDIWILSLHLVAISSVLGAINFLCTIHNMRAAGMSWMRIPLFVWAVEIYSILLLLAIPVISTALTFLLLDRQVGTHFFDPSNGGSAVLYQHLFWFFGHPEVYIIILPAMGVLSEVIPVFSRKPIFGYKAIAFSTVAIGFYSMLVWAHHMFSVGLPNFLNVFFMLSSMVIAVPTGVKIFNWIATTWRGNLILDTPMLWALGFLCVFTIGGLSGIFLAAFPVDWQVTDTYYVVAHMHYVMFGGGVFGVFAALFYWWPKIFGRLLDERLGKIQFWLVFIGFNLTFFPQHMLGLMGMPRRNFTYSHHGLWETYNLMSSIGSGIMTIGFLVFAANVVKTSRSGPRAGNDPWIADTLEWYTTSPPPEHNFDRVPYVTSARPLRDLRRRLAQADAVS
ncbi:MAG: cytochrome c oxidase subunit I [Gaiellaceae bacterium]